MYISCMVTKHDGKEPRQVPFLFSLSPICCTLSISPLLGTPPGSLDGHSTRLTTVLATREAGVGSRCGNKHRQLPL